MLLDACREGQRVLTVQRAKTEPVEVVLVQFRAVIGAIPLELGKQGIRAFS